MRQVVPSGQVGGTSEGQWWEACTVATGHLIKQMTCFNSCVLGALS